MVRNGVSKMAQEPDTSRVLEPCKDTGEIIFKQTVHRFAGY
ncbi:hypothetical protein ALQ95_101505 [Pseudomonas syringae pv. ribicola]|uniref:Uncharacterized protein n=1 Tax=Pseudomonas syringae pv. ribicola TaxID=55398 RepID=A0A3M2VRP4_PSESI|nr:hypothetical protein ALQ95_101505 [Pseudomonas syringae pv. ribicola]